MPPDELLKTSSELDRVMPSGRRIRRGAGETRLDPGAAKIFCTPPEPQNTASEQSTYSSPPSALHRHSTQALIPCQTKSSPRSAPLVCDLSLKIPSICLAAGRGVAVAHGYARLHTVVAQVRHLREIDTPINEDEHFAFWQSTTTQSGLQASPISRRHHRDTLSHMRGNHHGGAYSRHRPNRERCSQETKPPTLHNTTEPPLATPRAASCSSLHVPPFVAAPLPPFAGNQQSC